MIFYVHNLFWFKRQFGCLVLALFSPSWTEEGQCLGASKFSMASSSTIACTVSGQDYAIISIHPRTSVTCDILGSSSQVTKDEKRNAENQKPSVVPTPSNRREFLNSGIDH